MWESLATVRGYLWRYRGPMVLGMICLILKDVTQAMQPLMIRGSVDAFSKGSGFVRFALYLVGLSLLKGSFQFWMRVIFFGRAIHTRFERIQEMFSDISSRVQENLAGVRMIRAFAQERAELRRFEELNRQYIAQNIKLVRIQGVFDPLLEALIGLTFLM